MNYFIFSQRMQTFTLSTSLKILLHISTAREWIRVMAITLRFRQLLNFLIELLKYISIVWVGILFNKQWIVWFILFYLAPVKLCFFHFKKYFKTSTNIAKQWIHLVIYIFLITPNVYASYSIIFFKVYLGLLQFLKTNCVLFVKLCIEQIQWTRLTQLIKQTTLPFVSATMVMFTTTL